MQSLNLDKNKIEENFIKSNYRQVEKDINVIIANGREDSWLFNVLAIAYAKQKKVKLAEKFFLKVIDLEPDNFDHYYNLANLYKEIKEYKKCCYFLLKSLEIDPGNMKALTLVTAISFTMQEYDIAIEKLDTLLKLDPSNEDALLQRAIISLKVGKFENSLNGFYDLGKLKGFNDNLLSDIAICHLFLGNLEEAKKINNLSIDAKSYEYNDAIINLKLGNYKEGWIGFESGLNNGSRELRPGFEKFENLPFWDPKKHKKSIVLIGEQGVGDEIMYSTIIHELSENVENIFIFCDPRLKKIFEEKNKYLHFIINKNDHKNQKFESKLPMGSLPKYFRNTEEEFQSHKLVQGNNQIKNSSLNKSQNKNLIGLSWHTKNKQFGPERNIGLNQFCQLFQNKNYEFLNLQYGDCDQEINEIENKLQRNIFIDCNNDNTNDLEGLAENIKKCDLVISIDNSTAHLSGYLNQQTFLLLPLVSDWRWQEDRIDTPWYPSIKIFRQTKKFDWSSVMSNLNNELLNIF